MIGEGSVGAFSSQASVTDPSVNLTQELTQDSVAQELLCSEVEELNITPVPMMNC